MALVAKKYQEYEQDGIVFIGEDGHNYTQVKINGIYEVVRVYDQKQYDFLMKMSAKAEEKRQERLALVEKYNKERKIQAGFEKGYIIAVLGDTFSKKDYLKNKLGAKFNYGLGWYFAGGTEPESVKGFETRKVTWEEASIRSADGCEKLKDERILKTLVEVESLKKSNSEFQGDIGDAITKVVRIDDVRIIDGQYGRHAMHLVYDSKENLYIWNSSIANMLEKRVYKATMTVKEHNVYKNVKQTIVSSFDIGR